jgi:hypothetical protein
MSERLTAWQFLCWYAANHDPLQRGMVAAASAVSVITAACWPMLAASPVHGWLAVLAGAAALLLWVALNWLLLGMRCVQRWIIGDDPFGPGA